MRNRRKSDHCLNCHLELDELYNYCPQCGQENTDNRVTVRQLLRDLFDNYINLDSRLGRSLLPFLFKPGHLTRSFNEGNRVTYVHPVRFYFIISVIYFFTFAHVVDIGETSWNSLLGDSGKGKRRLHKVDSIRAAASCTDSVGKLPAIVTFETTDDSLPARLSSKRQHAARDTSGHKNAKITKRDVATLLFTVWLQDKSMTEDRLLDSLDTSKTPISRTIAHQALKIGRNDIGMFMQNTLDNIPVMMVCMLPLVALYLRLFYFRSGRLYIEHFVGTFHLQAFIYLLLTVALLIGRFTDLTGVVILLTPLIAFIYTLFMFRSVYGQSWVKTFVKVCTLSIFYICTLSLFLGLELIASFFLY